MGFEINMRIQNISYYSSYAPQKILNTKPYQVDRVSFVGKDDSDIQREKAQKYANKMKFINKFWPFHLQNYNMEKIEGIQSGIDIFEGLTIREVAFIMEDLHSLAVKRGCSNQCLHCYANAKPAGKDHGDYITRMPFEDFARITSGFKELSKRIGQSPIKHDGKSYSDFFYDADGMEISLFDKNGVEHDFTELNDMFYDATGSVSIFDTAGWNPNNPKMQARAEKYVKYFSDMDNEAKMHQINLSISPFNSIYAKAIELGFEPRDYNVKNQPWYSDNVTEDLSNGEKLYNIYINRMANMLMTFAPLLSSEKFSVIARPVKNSEPNMKYHREADYKIIKKQILDTLRVKLELDLNGPQKYAKTRGHIQYYIHNYSVLMNRTDTDLMMSGRYKDLYKSKNPDATFDFLEEKDTLMWDYRENFYALRTTNSLKNLPMRFLKVIDANGEVYMYDGYRFVPTELSLKLSSNNKTTPPLSPEPENFIVTREMINKLY